MVSYGFDAASIRPGRFCIADYDKAAPFASFLPGIAGPLGVPLWAFYVNRGQAMASFGVRNKDAAIMEFLPANRAYQAVPLTGFRTFIKLLGDEPRLFEPFSSTAQAQTERRMYIEASEVELEEVSAEHGLQVNVVYFVLPQEPFAGLVRQVSIKNIGTAPVRFEVLDGLPAIVPFGVSDLQLKLIGRTVEAWMAAYNLESGMPFYRVQATIGDEAEVATIEAGHFFLPSAEAPAAAGAGRVETLSPVLFADPAVIFGTNTSLTRPDRFLEQSLSDLRLARQVTVCRTPCAFAGIAATLAPGESATLSAIIGHVSDLAAIEAQRMRLARPEYLAEKRREAQRLTQQLTGAIATESADARFDEYCRQTLLDNVLRGGWPVRLGGKPYHLYGRRHGDLERDYNAFQVPPEFYSQGNAAYRDINQNRRCDVLLNPDTGDSEVLALLGLIQPDGYNPLVVIGSRFVVPAERRSEILPLVDRPAELELLLAEPFSPGQLLKRVLDSGMQVSVPPQSFVELVLACAEQDFAADHGEGYWIDHWYYNLDLIESYLAIFPDHKDELLFRRTVTYYDSAAFVRPRSQKYVLTAAGVRQYDAVEWDEEHAGMIAARGEWPHLTRSGHGHGPVFRTSVFAKLFGTALVKFATLDPFGMGIEMEAGKPGWCDALNGLPGLFGSAMPPTYELLRLWDFLLTAMDDTGGGIELPLEVVELLGRLEGALAAYDAASDDDRDFRYWDAVAGFREAYREATRRGFDGRTEWVAFARLRPQILSFRRKVAAGIGRAEAMGGELPPAYFTYEVADFEPVLDPAGGRMLDTRGRPHVRARRFSAGLLPPFLEGPVHALRVREDETSARELYRSVRASALYDRKLGMYKTNAPLTACSHEIGRLRAFTPGWLENESVFLHMAYKYLLEVLRAGLREEFFAEMRRGLVPFLDPAVYGRSTLENSSFIVSSAHPDESLHGRGFVARLTGACAEFLSMWALMMAGPQPFTVRDGELCLSFRPALPDWLFTEDGVLSFVFLGQCRVTYRRAKVTEDAPQVAAATLHLPDGRIVSVSGGVIPAPYAVLVRSGEIRRIELDLA